MKYCEKCGKQIEDAVAVCQECGCEVKTTVVDEAVTKPKKKFNKKLLYIIIPIAVVLILVLAMLYIRFLHKPKVDITLDDLTKPISTTSALFKYGAPDSDKMDDKCYYFDRVTLEGVEFESFHVNFKKGTYDESYSAKIDFDKFEELSEMLTQKAELISHEEYDDCVGGVDKIYIFYFEYEDMDIELHVTIMEDNDNTCKVYFICD